MVKVCLAVCLAMLIAACSRQDASLADAIDLIPVRTTKDGNWSMMNKKGEIVYDSEFKNEPTLSVNGIFSVQEGEGYTLYSSAGDKPKALSGCDNLKGVGICVDGLIPIVKPKERISVVDASGKKQFELGPIKDVEVERCVARYFDGLLMVCTEEGKWGYVDTSGKVVIEPKYVDAYPFSEGLAVVQIGGIEGKEDYYEVIDKSGKTVVKLKPDQHPISGLMYQDGRLLIERDDQLSFMDTKGEMKKVPGKAESVLGWNDKYIVYTNEEGQRGVMDFSGEVVVRPKYEHLGVMPDNSGFYAEKDDHTFVILDSKGEVVRTLDDYESLQNHGDFGWIVKEGSHYTLLDEDFKQKGKDDFYDYGTKLASDGILVSDYFSVEQAVNALVSKIDGNGVKGYQIGASAAAIFKDKELDPANFTQGVRFEIPEVSTYRSKYAIEGEAWFSAAIADYSYERHYYWNPESKLNSINLTLKSDYELGAEACNLIAKHMSAKGYQIIKKGEAKSGSAYVAFMKKGNTYLIVVVNRDNGKEVTLGLADNSVVDEAYVKSQFEGEADYEPVTETEAVVAEDVPAVDTAI